MTRLVWVIIFALLIGALVVISLKSLPGTRVNQRLVELEQARATLARMFPDSRFRIQFSTPNPGIRNLVVTIQPGKADSSTVAVEADSTESIIRRTIDLSGYDSIIVAVFDRVYRATPTR